MTLIEIPNTSDWMQAWGGIGTLVLGVAALIQGLRIETLTQTNTRLAEAVTQLENQTKELKGQTKVLSDSHNLQLKLTEPDRMPVFIPDRAHIWNAGGALYSFSLKNTGVQAYLVHFIPVSDKLVINYEPNFYSDGIFSQFDLLITSGDEDNPNSGFIFDISFRLLNGDSFLQRVDCSGATVTMGIPQKQAEG